jgi:GntR family transcriptional regulator
MTRRGHRQRPVRQPSLAAQTEEILASRLVDGELAPGDQLPSEPALAEEFGVSRATVRAAIGSLVHRGLIVQRHGVGNFVAVGSRITNNLAEAIDLTALLRSAGADPEILFDDIAIVPADPSVQEALSLDQAGRDQHGLDRPDRDRPGDVLRSVKRFMSDGAALVYVVNSIPVAAIGDEAARRAVRSPQITEPLFTFLEDIGGVRTTSQVARVEACLGSDVDHPASSLGADVAVLRIDETGYTDDTRPIWHSRTWFPPGAMNFELIRHRTGAFA